MKTALVGYTGFVGSNIANQAEFDDYFNSTTIQDIGGNTYELLVLSGVRAEKWKANSDPISDWDVISDLMDVLMEVQAKKVVVISTVDVFSRPIGVDEKSQVSMTDLHPYGKHRRLFEQFCQQRFDSMVVRLPGLFGTGLKKNIIFDLLNSNQVEKIDPASTLQWYYLDHLWKDISTALNHNLSLIHLATEPLPTRQLLELFGNPVVGNPSKNPVRYDLRTLYDELYEGSGGYLYSQKQVLVDMKRFIQSQRSTQ